MGRPVHHHAYVSRPYGAICDELEAHGVELIESATLAAAGFAADLAGYLEKRLGFFDREERVLVGVGEMKRAPAQTVIDIEWRADDDSRRLLPNVEAALHVTPIISKGPGATTELSLQGEYSPRRARRRGVVEHALASRVVDATLHTFVRHLAEALQSSPARR